jgi:hypothetical protein
MLVIFTPIVPDLVKNNFNFEKPMYGILLPMLGRLLFMMILTNEPCVSVVLYFMAPVRDKL